jgi:hypothetical protein
VRPLAKLLMEVGNLVGGHQDDDGLRLPIGYRVEIGSDNPSRPMESPWGTEFATPAIRQGCGSSSSFLGLAHTAFQVRKWFSRKRAAAVMICMRIRASSAVDWPGWGPFV